MFRASGCLGFQGLGEAFRGFEGLWGFRGFWVLGFGVLGL